MTLCIISDGLERIGKEVVLAYFKTLSWHSNGGTDTKHKNPQDSLCPAQYSNQAPLKYKSEALPLEPNVFGSAIG